MIKQIIVMRKDLNMRKGKMIAMGSHASMKIFFDRMELFSDQGRDYYEIYPTKEMIEWIEGLFTKIVVYVNSEQELIDIYNRSKEEKIPTCIIKDSGLTEFHGVQTYTCCAIGPDQSEKIDKITGHLSLL